MFVHMVTVRMVQMTIVKVIDVVAVLDSRVATVGSMNVVVIRMLFAAHSISPCSDTGPVGRHPPTVIHLINC